MGGEVVCSLQGGAEIEEGYIGNEIAVVGCASHKSDQRQDGEYAVDGSCPCVVGYCAEHIEDKREYHDEGTDAYCDK